MPSDDQDPIEDMEVGETQTLSNETEIFAHDIARDEFLGSDRRVENIQANARVQGNEVVVEVAGDVTRIDPHTKPVFQSAERYADRSDTSVEPTPAWKQTLWKATPLLINLAAYGGISYIAVNIIQEFQGATINGEPMSVPGETELMAVLFLIFFFTFGLQYSLPRVIGGVRS